MIQRMMDRILKPHKVKAAAYLDDVVMHSKDWNTHLMKVQAVLEAIRAGGLTATPAKCAIGLQEGKYLGFIIGQGLVKPQITKLEAIQNWPRPIKKHSIGHYRRFISNFASTAAPLTDLTRARGSVMVKWTEEAELAFHP